MVDLGRNLFGLCKVFLLVFLVPRSEKQLHCACVQLLVRFFNIFLQILVPKRCLGEKIFWVYLNSVL